VLPIGSIIGDATGIAGFTAAMIAVGGFFSDRLVRH
jgi:hypothetical protein